MPDDKPKLDIDWVRTIAGALAAVSSAVLLSTLGAAGTLIGAAIGSVTITLTSAFYSQGLATSRHKLAQARVVEAADGVDEAVGELEEAEDALAVATEEPDQPPPLRERLALLPWKQIGLWAAGIFVIAVVAITAFELAVGRSIGSFTGGSDEQRGTTISKVTGNSSGGGRDRDGGGDGSTSEPSPTTPTEAPTSQSPAEEPSESPTPTDDPVPGTPTTEPSEEPAEPEPTPSELVEPEPTPTE